jgi:hypothetical protein
MRHIGYSFSASSRSSVSDKTQSAYPMNKTWLSRILNLALWLVGSVLASTGLVLAFRLPPGSRGGRGLSLLGWTRHDWGDLHTWLAYAAVVLIVSHLLIHARWLWVVACQRRWPRLIAGMALGLALPVAALVWPLTHSSGGNQGAALAFEHSMPGR